MACKNFVKNMTLIKPATDFQFEGSLTDRQRKVKGIVHRDLEKEIYGVKAHILKLEAFNKRRPLLHLSQPH